MNSLSDAIKALHARKDRSYGAAWKRRGERISVLPNVARKVDRLVVFAQTQSEMKDEPIVDTVIDLLVYCGKYRLFLADLDHNLRAKLCIAEPSYPLSDHVENFNQLLDQVNWDARKTAPLPARVTAIEKTFETLWPMADAQSTAAERFEMASSLWADAVELVAFISREHPEAIKTFIEAESSIATESTQ